VTVFTLGGSAKVISGLDALDTLSVLRTKCVQAFEVPSGTVVQLFLGTKPPQVLGTVDSERTLRKLGIAGGTQLTLAVQTCVHDVRQGTRVRVSGAGSPSVNGTYTCKVREKHSWDPSSDHYFQQDDGTNVLYWVRNVWCFRTQLGGYPIYYNKERVEEFSLPCAQWESFDASLSRAGVMPGPIIELI